MPYLNDNAGNVWQLFANDDNTISAGIFTAGATLPFVLQDTQTGAALELRMNASTYTLEIYAAPNAPYLPVSAGMRSPNGTFYSLIVSSGIAMLALQGSPQTFAVGQLIPMDEAYSQPLQPGGAGTPVTVPFEQRGGGVNWAMNPDEMTGRFYSGCGHSLNNWELIRTAMGGTSACLVCCPLCRYVNRIISPWDLIYSADLFPTVM